MCEKLKTIFYKNEPWQACYKNVAAKFSELKTIARRIFPDKDDEALLKELITYTEQDLIDVFDLQVPYGT